MTWTEAVRHWFRRRRRKERDFMPDIVPARSRFVILDVPCVSGLNGKHDLTIFRESHTVYAISSPCGAKAEIRAAHGLGADNCWPVVELIIRKLAGDLGRAWIDPDDRRTLETATGSEENDVVRNGLRSLRRQRRTPPSWNRRELTDAAAARYIERVVGAGSAVEITKTAAGAKLTIKRAGAPQSEWSTYILMGDSWGAAGGPQVADDIYRSLNLLARVLKR